MRALGSSGGGFRIENRTTGGQKIMKVLFVNIRRAIGAIVMLAVTLCAAPAFAQDAGDNCTDFVKSQLDRESLGSRRLAVRAGDTWQYLGPEEALVLETVGVNDLCMAWEAPPYRKLTRQIVYASTRYTDNQPIHLFRRGQAPFEVLRKLFGDWEHFLSEQGSSIEREFMEFHRGETPEDLEKWRLLKDWHDTSAWVANKRSRELVKGTLALTKGTLPEGEAPLPYGTERLLVLAAWRPLASWIPIETAPPAEGGKLHVAISYSGDTETRLYRYTLSVLSGQTQ